MKKNIIEVHKTEEKTLYFYKRLKNDINGNSRFKLSVICNNAVLTRNVKCYSHDLQFFADKLKKDYLNN